MNSYKINPDFFIRKIIVSFKSITISAKLVLPVVITEKDNHQSRTVCEKGNADAGGVLGSELTRLIAAMTAG